MKIMKLGLMLGMRAKIGVIFVVCLCWIHASPQNVPADSTAIELRRPQARSMAGKARHTYTVNLKKGMYLDVAVKQRDVDVITELFGPDSTSLGKFDAPTSERGMERSRIGADEAGVYRIEVFTTSELAGPGEYTVEIETLRKTNESDARVLMAVGLQQEAIRLRSRPETRNDAIPVYERAAQIWRELRMPADEANTLRSIAFAYQRMEQFDKAKDHFARALDIWERIGDLRSAAFTHVIYGVYSRKQNDFKAALEHDLRARKLWLKANDRPEQTHNLVQIGNDYLSLRKNDMALAHFQQALDLVRCIGRKSIEALVLSEYGDAHVKLGNYAEALKMYRRSVELWKTFKQDTIAAGVEEKIAKLSVK